MSLYEEPLGEVTSESFWEVGNYKHTVRRVDDGHRLCSDMINCLHERGRLEKAYAQQLQEWAKKWKPNIEKGPQYGTIAKAWIALLSEAESRADLHAEVRSLLLRSDEERVRAWQRDSFHRAIMGTFKESRDVEEAFRKAQKPWAKRLKEVETSKKAYHTTCKEERLAENREGTARADSAMAADQLKKFTDKLDKCRQDTLKARERYERALQDLNTLTPKYMEDMEAVFDTCQAVELKRLSFFREVLLSVRHHLDLSVNPSFCNIFLELHNAISMSDTQEDLKLFRNIRGPGMPMNWPTFEEFTPDTSRTISRKEKTRKLTDGVTLTNITISHEAQRPTPESIPAPQPSPPPGPADWSDDEPPNPFGSNGHVEGNPFGEEDGDGEEETLESKSGVRVRALYDYEGQEEDELTFSSGEEFIKLEDEDEQGWCKGRLNSGTVGLYPANYVEDI
uniref:Protein kinase C and casein kinase substrate in neurons 3 n=1 Tax=Eptatretus burgeri TaxID=7764 RepID=A0A8C4WU53_EPTBU